MTLGLLLATLLGNVLADGAPPPTTLRVSAEPNHVVLRPGGDANLTITTEVRNKDGAPVAHAILASDATAGTISDFTEVRPGVYQATLSRPAESFPQVGVVTVFVEPQTPQQPPLVATTLVHFSAEVTLRGKTEPGASMRVELGGHMFGPVQVDATGHFSLPVTVPPGAGVARGISTDSLGNASSSQINLYLPALDRLHSFVYPRTTIADGQTPGWIHVTCLSNSGAPQAGAIAAQGARGQLGKAEALSPGLWRFAYVPPTTVAPGFDAVHFTGSVDAEEKIVLSPGSAAHGVLTVTPHIAPADNHTTAQVALLVTDAHANPTDAPRVRVEVDGNPLDVAHTQVGAYQATVPPRARIGESAVVATVWRSNDTPLPALQQSLTWRMPTPVTLALSVLERRAEGWVLRVDTQGDKDVAARLQWQASQGAVTPLAGGDFVLSVAAPTGDSVDVVARDARTGISAWVRVVVKP